jgi:hypothetical protein
MTTCCGVEVYLHAFFDLGTRRRWVVSFTPRPLYSQRNSPWYPLNRRLGGPQSVWSQCRRKKFPDPARIRTLIQPAVSGRGGEDKNFRPTLPARSISLYCVNNSGFMLRVTGYSFVVKSTEKAL